MNATLKRTANELVAFYFIKEALLVSKEKNKVLVKDALEKIDKKDARIKFLEQENLSKHTKLGQTQTKLVNMKSDLELNKEEMKKLHKLAVSYCLTTLPYVIMVNLSPICVSCNLELLVVESRCWKVCGSITGHFCHL